MEQTSRAAARWRRWSALLLLLGAVSICAADAKAAAEDEDEPAKVETGRWPNTYVDLNWALSSNPSGAVLLGLQRIPFATTASKSFIASAPLTIEATDRLTLYAGLAWVSSKSNQTPWSRIDVSDWTAGFSADIVQYSGGWLPTISLSGSVARPVRTPPFGGLTTWSAELDFDYPFNEEETKGVLAGVSFIQAVPELRVATVRPTTGFYGGAYYQWENRWKLTGRAGVQFFGGASIGPLVQLKRVAQSFTALDLEYYDENDNRLVGVSFALGWSPKPAALVTISTPLYIVRR
ncbi:MAG: hypothetical protein ABWZ80_11425 [Beijerinckiaceae bacterium]